MSEEHPTSPAGEFVMFASADGKVRVECRFENETLWLSQAMLCELYDKAKATISGHIKNIFEEDELVESSVVRFYRTTANDGKNYQVQYFSLPMVHAIGYRVRSVRGTQFRQWATQTLQEYLIKGFVMDDERLKNSSVGSSAVPDYFDEMLERIRANERRMYLRVREMFALAADYQPSLKETTLFFQTIQNKLHFACTGYTAAELIHMRANASQSHMGLTSFQGEEVRRCDVTEAKNSLVKDEVSELNRVVTMCLDFAEDQARRRQHVFLRDWQSKLDQFLQFNDRDVLQGARSISKKMADEKAQAEYGEFAEQQRRLKESEGEKNIASLLQWQPNTKKSK
ncbi:virulence RhuM family protein [Pantoea sp. GM01]|uniref:virulence RhuM family protein n=1 Tax=Pantoea sp. GM01 TaxID=1144320 RepID=UPI0002711712|nr:RhuM family protein [Pantoea sp. GM01]EJL81635.1 virulence protein [Pantoea sp. GM01]